MKNEKSNFKDFKKNFTIALVLLLGVSIANCSKDDAPAPQSNPPAAVAEQNPLAGFLSASGFNQKSTAVNGTSGERSLSFILLVDGKMTAIRVKVPVARNGIRVLIWDKADAIVLRTEAISIPTANMETTKTIEAINLVKNKEYIICFSVNDFYVRERTDASNVTYPFTVGDIKITGYLQTPNSGNMPNLKEVSFYSGDCSFKFQK